MTRRVLLAAYEVPGLGGASTSTYALFRKMRGDGVDVHLVNLIDAYDLPYIQYILGDTYGNPKHLPNVHNCVLEEGPYRRHDALSRLVEAIAPDVILGYGDIAALLLKLAAPSVRVVFYAAGSQQAGFQLARRRVTCGLALLDRCVRTVRAPAIVPGRERRAIGAADLIVACSDLIQTLLEYFFPYAQTCKLSPHVISQAEWIGEAAAADGGAGKPFAERRIDLLFVASSWSRVEKNLATVGRIAARLPDLRIGIVGDGVAGIPGATSYGFVADAAQVLGLMGDSKAVVCPSLFDASPGVLFQASVMGCNVVASKNCGNWTICHDELLVDPFSEDEFVEAAARAVRTKRRDNMQDFLERRSYARLLEVLAVL
jgi:glycosyltransferase involved in cell wall biosynthesis